MALILKTIELYDIPPRPAGFKPARIIGRLNEEGIKAYEAMPYAYKNGGGTKLNDGDLRDELVAQHGNAGHIFADLAAYGNFYSGKARACRTVGLSLDMRDFSQPETRCYLDNRSSYEMRSPNWHVDGEGNGSFFRGYIVGSKNADHNTEYATKDIKTDYENRIAWLAKHMPDINIDDYSDEDHERAATNILVARDAIAQIGPYEIGEFNQFSQHRSSRKFGPHIGKWRFSRLSF